MPKVTEPTSVQAVTKTLPNRWGKWIHQYLAVVALISIPHALVGAYNPSSLSWIDSVLSPPVDALRIFGLRIVAPGLDGPLGQQFYINQVGIATWGVILCTATTLYHAIRGNFPIRSSAHAIGNLMHERNWNAARAWFSLRGGTLLALILLTGWGAILFINGVFGWYVFHFKPNDWLILTMFTLIMIYLSGALLVPGALSVGVLIYMDLRNLNRHLHAKKE